MPDLTFLGRGPGAPFLYQGRGRFGDVAGEEAVLSALILLLATAPGEDPMRPAFGCQVWDTVFLGNESLLAPLAARYVRDAINLWEPRVTVLDVRCIPDGQGGYTVSLDYQTITANTPRNQVFSFNRRGAA